MDTTRYYEEEVRQKHPGIKDEWVERVLADPFHTETQPDGGIRYYGFIVEEGRWLRVVVADGKLLNRFFDRNKLKEWGIP